MYRTAVAAIAATSLLALPSITTAAPAKKTASLTAKYNRLYHKVAKTHGAQAPGRNIVKYGYRGKHGVRPATNAEKARSVRTFRRWLAPPIPAPAVSDNTPTAAAVSATTAATHTGGRYSIPEYIVQCESGGSYNAVNPSSGARGAYQLMPGTYAAYGGDGSWSPADQDRVAARLYAAEGSAPWSCR
jgi:hypothetical protein